MAKLPSNSRKYETAIQGLTEIREKLAKLESEMVKNINRKAIRAGAAVVRKRAIKNLPIQHRKGKIGIGQNRRNLKKNLITFKVGPFEKHWPLIFYEYGAKPHDITAKKKKAIPIPFEGQRWGAPLIEYFATRVEHPGQKATHFLSRAIDEGADEALDRIGKKYWFEIKKATKAK